ncbi:MAG: methyltransferase domain-containing protein [Alphaproteobacteria bacterium]
MLAPSHDGYLAYSTRSARLHRLNAFASLIVELCDGSRDREAIRDIAVPLVGEDGWPACSAWLDSALSDGLLESVAEGTPAFEPDAAKIAEVALRLREEGEAETAYVCQFNAAELAPDVVKNWYLLGDVAQATGHRDEARNAYERYLALKPEDAEIAHILIALRDDPAPARGSDDYIEYLFDAFAPYYDHNMRDELHYQAPELLHAAVAERFAGRTDLSVLDLGCGTGLSGVPFRAIAKRLTGGDLSALMVEKARERGIYDDLHVAELTAFLGAEAPDAYDLVMACDTFIYFGDLRQVVVPSARFMAADGLLVYSVEKSEQYPFRLTDSGRYAHHRDHVTEVAADARLRLLSLTEATLRFEYGEPVTGLIAVMSRTD